MVLNKKLESQAILDGMGQGILIFDSANRLIQENRAARTFLGPDLKLIRSEGWAAAMMLFNTRLTDPNHSIEAVRKRALDSERPIRFHTYRAGEYVPCWAAAIHGPGGEVYTMITIDLPDWSALSELLEDYLGEVRSAVDATAGHARLIERTIELTTDTAAVAHLSSRLNGFTRVIAVHMYRLRMLTELIERLEHVRTGKMREQVRRHRRKVVLADFMEDFLEELDEETLVDPESDRGNNRRRIKSAIPQKLAVAASSQPLAHILRDLLRNAIMYSMKATPIKLLAFASPTDNMVQIDVIDEGYGIRGSEAERVFLPFMRSRQPQVLGEFGYGISLYLCRHEVEAMNGRIWFESEEGVGTTFSVKLPMWRDDPAPAENASSPLPK
ncbi:MAG: sensor histidine kinase [Chloroflexi bacterium]|nr:sensor histidine kinase [Chloroflexota bacterium]